ncbi:hypothetical protein MQM1_028 [Aeromonas phage vB_AsaP_MQM1]|nr:hypothetical protein MQM1_028 [Aeromonas phage vB_AsaP_MQM1]
MSHYDEFYGDLAEAAERRAKEIYERRVKYLMDTGMTREEAELFIKRVRMVN